MLQKQATDWNCVPLQQQRGGQWLPMPIKQLVGGQWRLVGCKFEQYVMWTQPDFYYPMDEVVGDQLVDLTGNLNLDLVTVGSPTPAAGYEVVSSGGPVEGGPFVEFHGNRRVYQDQSNGARFEAVASSMIAEMSAVSVMVMQRANAFSSGSFGKRSVSTGIVSLDSPGLACLWDDYNLNAPQTWNTREYPGGGQNAGPSYHDPPADNYLPTGSWSVLSMVHRPIAGGHVSVHSYRDGKLIDTLDRTESLNPWENEDVKLVVGGLDFGAGSGNGAACFDGGIAHVAFWNRSLSDEEVKMIAKAAGVYS